ncbi:TRAP transporter large permease subunit [Acidisphaera sp. S103]|uniref:TRAP transporter large permease subunit n=1 Tax=Acidisphaera sp. S103 TaxID=1747223 RepID=UPI00131E92E7|nr:TRAP transporter large permease subunit [Acidisphaera sp. S103]
MDAALDVVVAVAIFGELAAVITDVLGRTLFDAPLLWADEVGGLALTMIAFIGGAVAYRRDQHIAVRVLVDGLPPRLRAPMYAAADWLVLETAVVCFVTSFPLLISRWDELTPLLQMHGTWLALPLTIGMALLAVYAIARLLSQPPRAVLVSLVVLLILNGVFWAAALYGPPLGSTMAITLAIAIVLVTVLLGLPVGFALVLATSLFLRQVYPAAMVALPQNMVDGVSRFVLLALPFFILVGFVMEAGGISRRLVLFVAALVGRLRGGLLQVVIINMYIVSGISGSKAADVAAVGLVMRDMLDKEGYERSETAVVLASAAAMGECVPPSIAMLVLGSVTSLSMGALFAAGLLPAAVIALCLMALVFVRVRRTQPTGASPVRGSLPRLALDAILPFSMPVLLFAGILSGFATPTEISAFAVLYGLILATLVYREVGLRALTRVAADASTVAAMVLFTLAAAQTFSWSLSAAQMPQALAALVFSWRDNTVLFLLASIVALVVLGSLLEGLPALLILAPLLLPIATQLGISDLHYGIVLLIAMGIGAFLPPLGVGFYIACAIARAPMGASSRAMMPYVAVLLAGLLLVTFVPWFTLSLPRAVGLAP